MAVLVNYLSGGQLNDPAPGLCCYAYATLISVLRLLAEDHFSSDVFVGGAIDFLSRLRTSYARTHRNHLHTRRSKLFSPAVSRMFSPAQKSLHSGGQTESVVGRVAVLLLQR